MTDCIFCKIINNEIPSAKVFENEHVVAFLDISQVTKGHTLVIPKVHRKNVYELTADEAREIFAVVPTIARAIEKAYKPAGINLLNNNEVIAGQTVFHFHLHLVPRYDDNDTVDFRWETHMGQYSPEQLQQIASDIAAQL